MVETAQFPVPIRVSADRNSQSVIRDQASNEFVFAVVGHIGAGVSTIAKDLRKELEKEGFQVELLKSKREITEWAQASSRNVPEASNGIAYINALQDLGDEMRRTDQAAVASALIRRIRNVRAQQQNISLLKNQVVPPDGQRRAYLLDSIRHPMEVQLLRQVYQQAFTLVGVVCNEEKRIDRLSSKLADGGRNKTTDLMRRDADAPEKYGQRVADAFHLADYFIDNSEDRLQEGHTANPYWTAADKLSRLVQIIMRQHVVRPTPHETAMHIAYGAQVRSACMSRQVGAAILDRHGNVLATGTNEVPKAGGGVYGSTFEEDSSAGEHRCIYRELKNPDGSSITPYCSNTQEQRKIIVSLVSSVTKADLLAERTDLTAEQKRTFAEVLSTCTEALHKILAKSPIAALLEFSRALHAEMDALLSAGRKGKSTQGARMYVTTYPCHYCARHIVGAGIDEVQYIEPYPKSKALQLHQDSISESPPKWLPPSEGGTRVLFHPFSGVAPRMYSRAFLKDREFKNKQTGVLDIQDAEWGSAWDVSRASYTQLEALLEANDVSK